MNFFPQRNVQTGMMMGAAMWTPALHAPVNTVVREARTEEAQATALLIRRCVDGEAAAWEEIVRLYSRRIYNICYRFAGSAETADDLTQEVFIRLYRTLGSFDGERASFNTWVTTVTRNLLVDHFRKTKNDRITDSIDAPVGEDEEGPTTADRLRASGEDQQLHVERAELRNQVQQALLKLSPELREAVILRDLQDMDYKEIAETLKTPVGTVKSRINRGRAELARILQRMKIQRRQ